MEDNLGILKWIIFIINLGINEDGSSCSLREFLRQGRGCPQGEDKLLLVEKYDKMALIGEFPVF